jgi:hypothetical protein
MIEYGPLLGTGTGVPLFPAEERPGEGYIGAGGISDRWTRMFAPTPKG